MPPAVVAGDHSIFIAIPACPVSFCPTCCKITGHIVWQEMKRDPRRAIAKGTAAERSCTNCARMVAGKFGTRTSYVISPRDVATSHETDLSDAVRQTQLLLQHTTAQDVQSTLPVALVVL
jgi:hypothetical protein